jgi:DNA (cytosine-5)-methyltransferase 3A
LDGEKSSLFYHYLRLLHELKPKYFLLENVKMKKADQAQISELLGVEPVAINSKLLSA